MMYKWGHPVVIPSSDKGDSKSLYSQDEGHFCESGCKASASLCRRKRSNYVCQIGGSNKLGLLFLYQRLHAVFEALWVLCQYPSRVLMSNEPKG
eukprot:6190152-Pleurochrysis_carterae.AAC.1